jgi:O-antigen ligase
LQRGADIAPLPARHTTTHRRAAQVASSADAPFGQLGRSGTIWPFWFGPASGMVVVAAIAGAGRATLFLLIGVTALAATRDLWQAGLTFLLGSLTLATASRDLFDQLSQPFLLRFILASGLLGLTLTLYPQVRRVPRAVARYTAVLGIFFGVATVGIIFTAFPRTAIEGVLGAAAILSIPLVATRGRWRRRGLLITDLATMHRFLWLATIVGLGLAVSAGFSGRAAGLHFNPNTYAFMCLLGFGLDLGLRKRLPWWALPVTAPCFVAGVLASGSRGALLGILIAPAYLLLRRRGRERSARIAAAMLVGFCVLLVAPLPGTFGLRDVIDRTFGGDEVDLSGRQQGWENMLVLARQRPLLGHGLRTTTQALGGAREVGDVGTLGGGHSSYLQIIVETGIAGAVPLFGAILLALAMPAPSDRDALTAWVAASGVVVAGLGHMIGESFVLGVGSPFPLVFWTCVTVLVFVGASSGRTRRAR